MMRPRLYPCICERKIKLKFFQCTLILLQEQLSKINARFREVNGGVVEKQRKLTKISEELDSVKQEMEERGTVMTDGSKFPNNI